MAQFKGKGALSEVNLVAIHYSNAVSRDKETGEIKGRAIELQLDARDHRAAGQDNLNLSTKKDKGPDGKDRFDNGVFYSANQANDMLKAAGTNRFDVKNKDGVKVGDGFALKADLMFSKDGNAIVNTKKPMGASDFQVDENTRDNQFNHMRETRAAKAAAKEAEKPAVQAEAPAPQQSFEGFSADVNEPEAPSNEEPAFS